MYCKSTNYKNGIKIIIVFKTVNKSFSSIGCNTNIIIAVTTLMYSKYILTEPFKIAKRNVRKR